MKSIAAITNIRVCHCEPAGVAICAERDCGACPEIAEGSSRNDNSRIINNDQNI